MEENRGPEVVNNVPKKNNVCALVSLIVSLVGIVIAGLPCGIIATITGIIGLVTFKKDTEKGKGMAIAGLIIGVLEIVIMILFMIMQVASIL